MPTQFQETIETLAKDMIQIAGESGAQVETIAKSLNRIDRSLESIAASLEALTQMQGGRKPK